MVISNKKHPCAYLKPLCCPCLCSRSPFFRQSPNGGDCDKSQNCAIYASKLVNDSWVALGQAGSGQFSNATKISGGSNADLQNPTIQNGKLFVSFLEDTDLGSGELWQPLVREYDPATNEWSNFCGGAIPDAKQSRKWSQGAGGFIFGQNDQPSFITYSQIIGSNDQIDLQNKTYTAAIAACQ